MRSGKALWFKLRAVNDRIKVIDSFWKILRKGMTSNLYFKEDDSASNGNWNVCLWVRLGGFR